MVNTKRSDMRLIEQVFDMGMGYVLDFSNRTFSEFFEDELGINIYQEKYHGRGSSKANLLRGFIDVEDGFTVGKALRKLYDYRTRTLLVRDPSTALADPVQKHFFEVVANIEAGLRRPYWARCLTPLRF
jgi:hypothetical protein